MSVPNNHSKKYSLTDIEQYLQGKLSPAEMHEMEKAAVQDPFLADAMEGYQSADLLKADQDLATIRLELSKTESKAAPVIRFASQKNKWLQAAAIILLLAGSSTLAWFLFKSDPQKKELVQQPVQKIKTDTPQTTTAKTTIPVIISKPKTSILAAVPSSKEQVKENDSSKSASYQKSAEMAASINESLAKTAKRSRDTLADKMLLQRNTAMNKSSALETASVGALADNVYRGQPLSTPLTVTSVGALNAVTVSGLLSAGTLNLAPLNIIQGKVVDINNNPVSFATVTAPNQITHTDSAGRFTIQVNDSIPKVKISALSFEEATAQLKLTDPNQITLKDFSGSLHEVVVVGYQTQKKKDITASVSAKKEASQSDLLLAFYPEKGWDALGTYLKNKLHSDASDKEIKGDSKVKLTVKNGTIIQAEIIQSFNESINKKLIRALKKGPKWISTDTANIQTHTITIHFK